MAHPISRPSFNPAAERPILRSPARAAELVRRYPNLSREQIDELVALLPRLNARDVALMIADEDLAPRLDAFWTTHRDLVSPTLSDYAAIALILLLPVLAFVIVALVS